MVEALFAHLDPDAGAANLHKAASVVRRVAGDRRVIVLEAGVVALWPDAQIEAHIERFEQQGRAALAYRDRPLGPFSQPWLRETVKRRVPDTARHRARRSEG